MVERGVNGFTSGNHCRTSGHDLPMHQPDQFPAGCVNGVGVDVDSVGARG